VTNPLSDEDAAVYETAARTALAEFGVPDSELHLVSVSENITYRATNSDSQFVVRLHRPGYLTYEELESEAVWLQALTDGGLDVPHPLTALNGQQHVLIPIPNRAESRYGGLSRWVDGDVVGRSGQPTLDHFAQLGALMGTLHNQASQWNPPGGFRRRRLDSDGLLGEEPSWGRFWEHPALADDERRQLLIARDQFRETLADYGTDCNTFSMIHADLHLNNLLTKPDGNLSIIDFDDAGFGWHQYDLAVALFHSDEAPDRPAARRALINAYRDTRPISDNDLALVSMFEVIRGMAVIGWIDQRPELGLSREFVREVIETTIDGIG
jgi:Ser/Thr protein kinase RdoA (MazF antagonist)